MNNHWQIGCFTRPWGQFDYRAALDDIAEAGFQYLGLMSDNSKQRLVLTPDHTPEHAEQVGQQARSRGLQIVSTYGGNLPVARSLEAGIDWLKKLIDYSALADSTSILLCGISKPELEAAYYKAIGECCDYAAARKIQIVLKPHGPLNYTGKECRRRVEKVGHPNFRMWFDPGNVYSYSDGQLDPAVEAEVVAHLVTGMCVKDFQRSPKTVHVTPGSGMVDFAAVMDHLRGPKADAFRQGPLVVETVTPGDRAQLVEQARKARLFVEKLVLFQE